MVFSGLVDFKTVIITTKTVFMRGIKISGSELGKNYDGLPGYMIDFDNVRTRQLRI